ncbi:MAG: hypothetical protein R2741_10480 [Methanolobus sp.]
MDKISELIGSHFPGLGKVDIKRLAAGFENLDEHELGMLLHAGEGARKRGMRVLLAFLGAAPDVYKHLENDDFEKWLDLARKVSKLSVSCCEGFFDSSKAIIDKGELELLEYWTNTGISLAEQNKWMSIAYFKHTGKVIISTTPEEFHELVENGRKIGEINVKVAEAYFEQLLQLKSLLKDGNFARFCHITGNVIKNHWLTAIELINLAVKVLPDVNQERIESLPEWIKSMNSGNFL